MYIARGLAGRAGVRGRPGRAAAHSPARRARDRRDRRRGLIVVDWIRRGEVDLSGTLFLADSWWPSSAWRSCWARRPISSRRAGPARGRANGRRPPGAGRRSDGARSSPPSSSRSSVSARRGLAAARGPGRLAAVHAGIRGRRRGSRPWDGSPRSGRSSSACRAWPPARSRTTADRRGR